MLTLSLQGSYLKYGVNFGLPTSSALLNRAARVLCTDYGHVDSLIRGETGVSKGSRLGDATRTGSF